MKVSKERRELCKDGLEQIRSWKLITLKGRLLKGYPAYACEVFNTEKAPCAELGYQLVYKIVDELLDY